MRTPLFSVALLLSCTSHAKEFVATSEWQVLDPEDSIPAGLHVRVDLETGQRFAKLAVEGDEDIISTHEDLRRMRQGGGRLVSPESRESPSNAMILGGQDSDESTGSDHFDYDLMYRTYLRIPEDERPPLPDRDSMSTEDFQRAMQAIWDGRQQNLQKGMDNIADLPSILESILVDIKGSMASPVNETALVYNLEELEFMLNDIDIARDFFILGGWQVLIDLSTSLYPVSARVLALHCMGTATKNQKEFEVWVEPAMPSVIDALSSTPSAVIKAIYALGAFLRNNLSAQIQFLELSGPEAFISTLSQHSHDPWIVSRLGMLATDLLKTSSNPTLAATLTGEVWCSAMSKLMLTPDTQIQERALLALQSMVQSCSMGDEKSVERTKLVGIVNGAIRRWENDASIDPEYKAELKALAKDLLK